MHKNRSMALKNQITWIAVQINTFNHLSVGSMLNFPQYMMNETKSDTLNLQNIVIRLKHHAFAWENEHDFLNVIVQLFLQKKKWPSFVRSHAHSHTHTLTKFFSYCAGVRLTVCDQSGRSLQVYMDLSHTTHPLGLTPGNTLLFSAFQRRLSR